MSLKDKAIEWFARRALDKEAKEGSMIGKLWSYLNGKKLVLGAIITIVGTVVEQTSTFLPSLIEPGKAAQYIGVATAVVGALHKLYKFAYKEDVPKG